MFACLRVCVIFRENVFPQNIITTNPEDHDLQYHRVWKYEKPSPKRKLQKCSAPPHKLFTITMFSMQIFFSAASVPFFP